ncbi:hypothetical protein [Gordonia aichiensis]|uniref:hypothetical protein n=1 Tax=Gordonia aichiensis TaxID=36820 RepID=UPI003265D142
MNTQQQQHLQREWVDPLNLGDSVAFDVAAIARLPEGRPERQLWRNAAGIPLVRKGSNDQLYQALAPAWPADRYAFSPQGIGWSSQQGNLADYLDLIHTEQGARWDEEVNGPAERFLTCDATITSWQCTKTGDYFCAPVRAVCQLKCFVCHARSVKQHGRPASAHGLKLWSPERNWPLRPEHLLGRSVAEFVCPDCNIGWNTYWECVDRWTPPTGCPRCKVGAQTSISERWIARSLQHLYRDTAHVDTNVPVAGFKGNIDITIDTGTVKVAIEYDGWYYHGSTEQFERDERKTRSAIDDGYAAVIRLRQEPVGQQPPLPNVPHAHNIPAGKKAWDIRVLRSIANIIREHDPAARTVTVKQAKAARDDTVEQPAG